MQSHYVGLLYRWGEPCLLTGNSCRCGSQFCYSCGARWQTCQCPLWDEQRLLANANAIADWQAQRAAVVPAADAARPEDVGVIAARLRYQGACHHRTYWNRIDGSHLCQRCNEQQRLFVLRCSRCGYDACLDCKRVIRNRNELRDYEYNDIW